MAGLGRAGGRAAAAGVAVAGAGTARVAAAAAAGFWPRRGAQGRAADAADAVLFVGGAGEPAGRHRIRGAAGRWQRGLAVLLRSPGRISARPVRSEEHTSELQSLMRISYAVFCL